MIIVPGILHARPEACNPCTGRPSTCYHSSYHDDDDGDDVDDDVGQDIVMMLLNVDDLSHVDRTDCKSTKKLFPT